MSAAAVRGMAHENFPSFLRQRTNAFIISAWGRGLQREVDEHEATGITGAVYAPRETDDEYKQLSKLSSNPLGGLIVTSLAQTVYVEGVRRPDSASNMEVWQTWLANGWDAKQISLHRAAIEHGVAFSTVSRGTDPLTGDKRASMDAFSAKRMAAFYEDPNDEWCMFALKADPVYTRDGFLGEWTVEIIDEEATYFLSCEDNGYDLDDWSFISFEEHGFRVPPVVRYANRIDLDGEAVGEIEPVLPMLARIDQDTFDRLIVQRFGAWKVRYIAGMAKPSTQQEEQAQAMKLRVQDLLVSTNENTKFGTLDASDLKQFLESIDHDMRMLAAVTQTPPHHLLGLSSNLQAEALTAATEGLQRKSGDFRMLNGQSHEQNFRLVAIANDNQEEARATDMQVRWRDTESRSLVQTANALGIVATALKVPVEMLWERLPGWSDQDSERAKKLVESGEFEKLLGELESSIAASTAKEMADAVPPEPAKTGGSDN